MKLKLRQQNAHSIWRRLHNWLRRTFTGSVVKTHTVHFIRIGEGHYKRVAFPDTSEAVRVERNLQAVSPLSWFPSFVSRHENEIWISYVDGRVLDTSRSEDVNGVIALFAALYSLESSPVPLPETTFPARLQGDIRFLSETGVLATETATRLLHVAGELQPDKVWVGFEYIDPVAKNFIVTAEGPIAIDVEALHEGQLLGSGLAKARLRWLQMDQQLLAARIMELGGPDLRPQFDFATLVFLAAYTRQKVFQGKSRYVRPEEFERFLAELRK